MQEGHHPMCENRVYDINLQNIVIDFFFCQIYKELIWDNKYNEYVFVSVSLILIISH